jgi:tight adherence protein C
MRTRAASGVQNALSRLALRLSPGATVESIDLRLLGAGMARTLTPVGFLTWKVVLGATGTLAGGLLGTLAESPLRAILLALVLGAGGFVLPDVVVSLRTKSRREEMRAELPDALDVLAVSVEAGLGFDAALARLAEELEGPLVEELSLTLSEMRIGESRQDALRKLADRVDVAELTSVVHALVQADQLGSPLARVLRVQAQEARLRRQQAAEERAMKAPVKMIVPTALFIFPAMFVVILGPALLHLAELF